MNRRMSVSSSLRYVLVVHVLSSYLGFRFFLWRGNPRSLLVCWRRNHREEINCPPVMQDKKVLLPCRGEEACLTPDWCFITEFVDRESSCVILILNHRKIKKRQWMKHKKDIRYRWVIEWPGNENECHDSSNKEWIKRPEKRTSRKTWHHNKWDKKTEDTEWCSCQINREKSFCNDQHLTILVRKQILPFRISCGGRFDFVLLLFAQVESELQFVKETKNLMFTLIWSMVSCVHFPGRVIEFRDYERFGSKDGHESFIRWLWRWKYRRKEGWDRTCDYHSLYLQRKSYVLEDMHLSCRASRESSESKTSKNQEMEKYIECTQCLYYSLSSFIYL
jgi:hypothetical protein